MDANVEPMVAEIHNGTRAHMLLFFFNKNIIIHYDFFWKTLEAHTYELFTLANFFETKRYFLQKRQISVFKNVFLDLFWPLILSFLYRVQKIVFHSKILHECEQCICVCLQIFSEFFIMFYYFLFSLKIRGACELGCKNASPVFFQQTLGIKCFSEIWRLWIIWS